MRTLLPPPYGPMRVVVTGTVGSRVLRQWLGRGHGPVSAVRPFAGDYREVWA